VAEALDQIALGLFTGLALVGAGIGMTLRGPRKWVVLLPSAALVLLGVWLLGMTA
jgi:hypothetical protein